MSTVRNGNACENFVASEMEKSGYVVASRRHRKGGGDLLAVWPFDPKMFPPPWGMVALVEVKKCPMRGAVFGGGYFSRAQRAEMFATALPAGGKRWLARVSGSGKKMKIEWVDEAGWP